MFRFVRAVGIGLWLSQTMDSIYIRLQIQTAFQRAYRTAAVICHYRVLETDDVTHDRQNLPWPSVRCRASLADPLWCQSCRGPSHSLCCKKNRETKYKIHNEIMMNNFLFFVQVQCSISLIAHNKVWLQPDNQHSPYGISVMNDLRMMMTNIPCDDPEYKTARQNNDHKQLQCRNEWMLSTKQIHNQWDGKRQKFVQVHFMAERHRIINSTFWKRKRKRNKNNEFSCCGFDFSNKSNELLLSEFDGIKYGIIKWRVNVRCISLELIFHGWTRQINHERLIRTDFNVKQWVWIAMMCQNVTHTPIAITLKD